MSNHKARHVCAGRGQRAGWRWTYQFIRLYCTGAHAIALRHARNQPVRKRLSECGICHPQWCEDMAFDIIVVALARDALNDVTCKRNALVAVRRYLPGRKDAMGRPGFQVRTKS